MTLGDDFVDSNGNAVRYGANFVASDVAANPNNLDIGLSDYVHEVGNALGAETGMDDPFGAYAAENLKYGIKDADVGQHSNDAYLAALLDFALEESEAIGSFSYEALSWFVA